MPHVTHRWPGGDAIHGAETTLCEAPLRDRCGRRGCRNQHGCHGRDQEQSGYAREDRRVVPAYLEEQGFEGADQPPGDSESGNNAEDGAEHGLAKQQPADLEGRGAHGDADGEFFGSLREGVAEKAIHADQSDEERDA
jgi:hypothetical protein